MVPRTLLNWANTSSVPGSRSTPAKALASACGYQVAGCGALVKSRCTVSGPAEPSRAEAEPQSSGSKLAAMRISTSLCRTAPQIEAAYWKAFSRCAPRVTPGLPPTGATAVGSLKPSPAPSSLTTVTVAADSGRAPSERSRTAIKSDGRRKRKRIVYSAAGHGAPCSTHSTSTLPEPSRRAATSPRSRRLRSTVYPPAALRPGTSTSGSTGAAARPRPAASGCSRGRHSRGRRSHLSRPRIDVHAHSGAGGGGGWRRDRAASPRGGRAVRRAGPSRGRPHQEDDRAGPEDPPTPRRRSTTGSSHRSPFGPSSARTGGVRRLSHRDPALSTTNARGGAASDIVARRPKLPRRTRCASKGGR